MLYNVIIKGGVFIIKGILICGLNGTGKSTLGKALSEQIGYHFIDSENLFFERNEENESYHSPRSKEDAVKKLMNEVKKHKNFVFAAVKGDYGEEILPLYKYVFELKVPKNERMSRIKNRSFIKFGERMKEGGDLYEAEEAFFKLCEERDEDYTEKWAKTLNVPYITLDGTKTTEENTDIILKYINFETT